MQFRPCQQAQAPLFILSEEAAKLYDLLQNCMMVTRIWAEKIPGFVSLCPDDQTALIEASFFDIFMLRLAIRFAAVLLPLSRSSYF